METFFFISLGITFVLILLLVYHFKQRLSAIEEKNDTMFDIINNIVQELTTVKTFVVANMAQQSNFITPAPTSYIPPSVYESQSAGGIFSQNQASEDKDEDDDESSEDESGSEVDTDSEDEGEDSDDERIVVSDNESEINVKVVNIPITPVSETVDISEGFEVESITEVNDLVESLPEINVEASVVVHKLDSTEETTLSTPAEEKDEAPASYSKLSTAELKKLVIARGLATEVGKMKKPQLVQLLESGVSE